MTTATLVRQSETHLARQPSTSPATAAVPPPRLRCVVLLDGSEISPETTRSIKQITTTCRGDVFLLRVIEPELTLEPLEDPLTDEAARAEARSYLRTMARQLAIDGMNVQMMVVSGQRTAAAVTNTAREWAADVIVAMTSPTP